MDAITQLQNYILILSRSIEGSVAEIHDHGAKVPANLPPQHFDTAPMSQRADETFTLFAQADILMASLPAKFASEAEQLRTIASLEEQNVSEGERLERARADAELWRGRLCKAFRQVASDQLQIAKPKESAPSSSAE